MALILELPEQIEKQLQQQADSQALSPEAVALQLLQEALTSTTPPPTPQEVVDKIKQLPPNPHAFRPAQGSLAEALENAPTDPDFDLEEWTKEWQLVEAELRAMTIGKAHAEGRQPKSLQGIIQLPEKIAEAMDDVISQVQRTADQEAQDEVAQLMGNH